MNARRPFPFVLTAVMLGWPLLCVADDAEDPISDYLVDLSPGPISAAEMLGLASSAVTTIQAPKDFIAALTSANGGSKDGFGLSITPARTSLSSMSIRDYGRSTPLRLWANTSFSYAQNRKDIGGQDYRQDALAVHVALYQDKESDPAVKVHAAFRNCAPVREGMAKTGDDLQQKLKGLKPEEIAAKVRQMKEDGEFGERSVAQAKTALLACMKANEPPAWNATQYSLTLGQGWIRGPGTNDSRLSLGRSAALSAAIGVGTQGQLNLALRRSSHELDLDTIGGTPAYKSSTLAALRYTYGHGDNPDLYALAEISNAKDSQATVSNSAFKAALGIDKRVMEGAWLEFRVGRSRSISSGKEETKALLNLKLSPTTTVPKAVSKIGS